MGARERLTGASKWDIPEDCDRPGNGSEGAVLSAPLEESDDPSCCGSWFSAERASAICSAAIAAGTGLWSCRSPGVEGLTMAEGVGSAPTSVGTDPVIGTGAASLYLPAFLKCRMKNAECRMRNSTAFLCAL